MVIPDKVKLSPSLSAKTSVELVIFALGAVLITLTLMLVESVAPLSASTIQFGADQDVTLTHVADTGLLLNTTMVVQFRDSAINIGSPADGDLDINADDEIELNSTLIDINGNVEISGTAVTTGVHTFTAVPVFPNNTDL